MHPISEIQLKTLLRITNHSWSKDFESLNSLRKGTFFTNFSQLNVRFRLSELQINLSFLLLKLTNVIFRPAMITNPYTNTLQITNPEGRGSPSPL